MMSALALGCAFFFFCGMMVPHLIWLQVTKDVPLEAIERQLKISP
jgi:hypothetical protein